MGGHPLHPGDSRNLTRDDSLRDTAIIATAGRHASNRTPDDEAITELLEVATELPPKSRASREFYDFYTPRLRLDLIARAAGHHLARARHDTMAEYRAQGKAAYDLLALTLKHAGGITPELQQIVDDTADWVGHNITHPPGPGIGNPRPSAD